MYVRYNTLLAKIQSQLLHELGDREQKFLNVEYSKAEDIESMVDDLNISLVSKQQSSPFFLSDQGCSTSNKLPLNFQKNAKHYWGRYNLMPKSMDQPSRNKIVDRICSP